MVIKKKGHPKFNVPNYGTKGRSRIKDRWRSPRGIDSKKREKRAFMGAIPTIGYKNPENVRHLLKNGKYSMVVHNAEELNRLLENPDTVQFDVVIAKSVGRRKRIAIAGIAEKHGIRVRNGAVR